MIIDENSLEAQGLKVTTNPDEKNKILESISKSVPKDKKKCKRISNLNFYCYICAQSYNLNRKTDDGKLELPQQVCMHVTLRSLEMI